LANTFNFVVKNGITVGTTPVIASNGTYISAIANTGVQPGIYGNTSSIPVITVGADGRVTAISNTAVATPPATAAIVTSVDTFTANGTGQTFVLSQTPYNINATVVNINGATQQKSSYTLSGNTITLSEIVPNGTIIEVSTNYNAANTGTNSGALVSTVDAFTANGNTTIFTLSSAPVNKNYTFVNIDGIDQQKSTYSITGNVITFSTAPPNGTSVEITSISSQTGAVFTYNTSGTNGQVLTLQSGAAVWANVNSTTSIANTGIIGLITSSQIANVANTQITGVLTASQGGTGSSSTFVANGVVYASSTNTLTTGSNLVWTGTNLGIGTGSPNYLLTLSGGNLGFTSGTNGIIFNNSSATTNSTLNDYETGTWTPKAGDGTTSMSTITKATYTKIGNKVFLEIDVTFPNPNPTNYYQMTNLPFTASTASSGNGGLAVGYFSTSASTTGVFGHVSNSTTNLVFYTAGGSTINMSGVRIIAEIIYQATF